MHIALFNCFGFPR